MPKASSAVTRWMVLRINDRRTTERSYISCDSSSGWKSTNRVHKPVYGASAAWDCIPVRCSIASRAEADRRSSNHWRDK